MPLCSFQGTAEVRKCLLNFVSAAVSIHLLAWQACFFIFRSKALLRMGRLELLFTSFTNSLQPRRNVQSSHVKGFNKARGMLLVIGVGHREAKSYKAQLPSGAMTVFRFSVVATSAHLVSFLHLQATSLQSCSLSSFLASTFVLG